MLLKIQDKNISNLRKSLAQPVIFDEFLNSLFLGLTGSICICLSFFTKSWLNVIVDQSGMENDPLADINQQEAAESPDAGFYGLWDYGPSDFKKSFLNCEAIPFAVCMYTRN